MKGPHLTSRSAELTTRASWGGRFLTLRMEHGADCRVSTPSILTKFFSMRRAALGAVCRGRYKKLRVLERAEDQRDGV